MNQFQSDTQLQRVAWLICLMAVTGIIGSYCRHILDRTSKSASTIEIVVPGLVAAFIVPLFLSFGKSDIISLTIKGGDDKYSNFFIVAAFCLLAGASARNFVDALAKDALRAANRAEEAASRAEKKVEKVGAEVAETKDIVAEDLEPPPLRSGAEPSNQLRENFLANADGNERLLIQAFLDHPNKARVLSSLAKEVKIADGDAYISLKQLVNKDIVTTWKSERTGSRLYRLIIDD